MLGLLGVRSTSKNLSTGIHRCKFNSLHGWVIGVVGQVGLGARHVYYTGKLVIHNSTSIGWTRFSWYSWVGQLDMRLDTCRLFSLDSTCAIPDTCFFRLGRVGWWDTCIYREELTNFDLARVEWTYMPTSSILQDSKIQLVHQRWTILCFSLAFIVSEWGENSL